MEGRRAAPDGKRYDHKVRSQYGWQPDLFKQGSATTPNQRPLLEHRDAESNIAGLISALSVKDDTRPKQIPVPLNTSVPFSQTEKAGVNYLHAFTSLVSLDKLQVCESKNSCEIKEEKGWVPANYFLLHKHILDAIPQNTDSRINSILETQKILVSGHLIPLDEQPDLILQSLEKLTKDQFLVFPWRTSDHQIYVQAACTSDSYLVDVFNLGTGLVNTDIATNTTTPRQIPFSTLVAAKNYFNTLVKLRGIEIRSDSEGRYCVVRRIDNPEPIRPSENEFYTQYVYNGVRVSCNGLCPPEALQPTENCVVKNLLFVMRYNCIRDYGQREGEELYRTFYLEMIKACLKLSMRNAPNLTVSFLTDIPVCRFIETSQQAFLGVGCGRLGRVIYDALAQVPQTSDRLGNVSGVKSDTLASVGAYQPRAAYGR